MNKRRKIFLALTVLWMLFIFLQSAMTGNESSSESSWAGHIIANITKPGFGSMTKEMQDKYVESIMLFIRKGAHMTEYAILMGLLMGWLYDSKKKITLLWCFIFTFAYACTDELHQLFVPDRAGRFTDVLIDCAGAIIGMLLVLLVMLIVAKHRARKE